MIKLIIIGAGGHAKSVIDSINADKIKLVGFIDEKKVGCHWNYPILGNSIESISNYKEYKYFVAIGDNHIRKKWYEKIIRLNLQLINIVDATAIISEKARIGKGCFVGKMVIINADTVIGDNCVINTKALIEHECRLGNHIHISTNAVVNGNVMVNDGVFLGSGAIVNGQLFLGSNSTIGSGAVVIKDINNGVTAVGVPAKNIKNVDKTAQELPRL